MPSDDYGDHERGMPRRTITLTKRDDDYLSEQMRIQGKERSVLIRDAIALMRRKQGERGDIDVAALRERVAKMGE